MTLGMLEPTSYLKIAAAYCSPLLARKNYRFDGTDSPASGWSQGSIEAELS